MVKTFIYLLYNFYYQHRRCNLQQRCSQLQIVVLVGKCPHLLTYTTKAAVSSMISQDDPAITLAVSRIKRNAASKKAPPHESAGLAPYYIFILGEKRLFTLLIGLEMLLLFPVNANLCLLSLSSIQLAWITRQLISLKMTSYIMLQGFGTDFYGEPGDLISRTAVYLLTFTIYVAATLTLLFKADTLHFSYSGCFKVLAAL